jgi:hypothetical protein
MSQLTTVAIDTRANLELARAFADSKMVPEHFKKSVGDCYIAINLASRYGMDPWTLMQEMYIISGKPMMSGKLATAILNHSLADPLRPEYSGDGDERTIKLTGRPEDETAPLSVTLKVKDAKTANEQWKKNPDQMLMYAGARMWGRRYAPDILLGVVFDDEEIPGVTTAPLVPATATPRTQFAAALQAEVIDEKTGEVFDSPQVLSKVESEKWYDWGARFVACFRGARDIDTIDAWLAANADTLAECEKSAPKVHGNILSAVKQCKLDLLNRETAAQ